MPLSWLRKFDFVDGVMLKVAFGGVEMKKMVVGGGVCVTSSSLADCRQRFLLRKMMVEEVHGFRWEEMIIK
ncbi:hypothetical protein Tco_0502268 [Tanacetum coccineum]